VNATQTRDLVLDVIDTVAPGATSGELDPRRRMRDEMDLDSLDFLRIVQAIHDRTGVDIPESDYGTVETLDSLVDYVAVRSAS
jgi:acyl carrier protein